MHAGHGAKFPRKKQEAITALMRCQTIQSAAQEIGVAPKTLSRWIADPEFKKAYTEAQVRHHEHAMARMQQHKAQAVSVASDILNDPKVPAATRLRAAAIILDSSIPVNGDEEFEARVAKLEDLMIGGKG
jgi:pyocin large subunit-like protein